MSVADLLAVVPRPHDSVDAGPVERWPWVEHALGIRLPDDYRDYALWYGSGSFVGRLCVDILNPFSADYLDSVHAIADELRRMRKLQNRREVPYGVFPDQPGWLPLGGRESGVTICWVTEGEPDRWPLLLIATGRGQFQQVSLPLTTFLARTQSGLLRTIIDSGRETPGVASPIFRPTPRDLGSDRARLSGEWVNPVSMPRPAEKTPSRPRIEWFPPDGLGRCTGVRAWLGPADEQATARILMEYPNWWVSELPAPRTRWCRRALLPWCLGDPEASAARNLVALTWRCHFDLLGVEGYLGYQLSRGYNIVYTVHVRYEGSNRYPKELYVERIRRHSSTWPTVDGPVCESLPNC